MANQHSESYADERGDEVGWALDHVRDGAVQAILASHVANLEEQLNETEAGSSAADEDGADQAVGHHESVGERQGRQPASDDWATVHAVVTGVELHMLPEDQLGLKALGRLEEQYESLQRVQREREHYWETNLRSCEEQLEAAQARIAQLEQSWHDSASMATYTQSASSPAISPTPADDPHTLVARALEVTPAEIEEGASQPSPQRKPRPDYDPHADWPERYTDGKPV